MRWRAGDFERVVSTQAGRAGEALLPSPRRDAQDGRTGGAGKERRAARAWKSEKTARCDASARTGTGPGVQERAADGFTASPVSTRCTQAGRAGSAGKERRAARVRKSEKTARCVRPHRNRAGYSARRQGTRRRGTEETGAAGRAAQAGAARKAKRGGNRRRDAAGAAANRSSRAQEQGGMSRAWPPPGSAGCARKRVEIEGAARRFAWAGTDARHPFPGRRGAEKEVQCRARRR